MGSKHHSQDKKAQVMAALLVGQSVNEVAQRYKIPASTVRGWESDLKQGHSATVKKDKRERVSELVAGYLEKALETLICQADGFKDTAWLKDHEPSEAAVLHGVLMDKVVRILEAAEAGQQQQGAKEGEE